MSSRRRSYKMAGRLREIGSELEAMGENIAEELAELGLAMSPEELEGDDALVNGKPLNLNDLNLGGCDDSGRGDIVDVAIMKLTHDLIDLGHNPNKAVEVVFTALADLIAADEIEDSPDIDEPENVKAMWVAQAVPKVKGVIQEMGILSGK